MVNDFVKDCDYICTFLLFCEGLWLHLHISVVLWGIVITFAHFCCFVIYVYKKELEVPRYGKNVRTWTLWIVEWINSLTSTLITSLLICQTMERFFSNFLLAIRYEAKSNSIWGEGARSSETYGAQPKPPKAPILNTIFYSCDLHRFAFIFHIKHLKHAREDMSEHI